ncbi:MAG TPA: hypothetical protein PKD73_05675 [Burkholderiaceae bacterium]|jgi:hypothetical protein|nr:hypothetical protein [Burkholderiaceae bacterium]
MSTQKHAEPPENAKKPRWAPPNRESTPTYYHFSPLYQNELTPDTSATIFFNQIKDLEHKFTKK